MATTQQRDPEWIDQAPIQIRRDVVIEQDVAWVWSQLANNEGWVEWFPGAKECRFVSEAPHGRDSVRHVHMDQFKVKERITRWVPNEQWGMTVMEINAPIIAAMAEEARLTASGSSTTLTFAIGVELRPIGRLLRRPLVAKQAKALEEGLANLAALATKASAV